MPNVSGVLVYHCEFGCVSEHFGVVVIEWLTLPFPLNSVRPLRGDIVPFLFFRGVI